MLSLPYGFPYTVMNRVSPMSISSPRLACVTWYTLPSESSSMRSGHNSILWRRLLGTVSVWMWKRRLLIREPYSVDWSDWVECFTITCKSASCSLGRPGAVYRQSVAVWTWSGNSRNGSQSVAISVVTPHVILLVEPPRQVAVLARHGENTPCLDSVPA